MRSAPLHDDPSCTAPIALRSADRVDPSGNIRQNDAYFVIAFRSLTEAHFATIGVQHRKSHFIAVGTERHKE